MGDKRRKNGSLITKGGLGSALSVATALVLLIRQIPITNMIGDEGMGYFSGAYELYTALLFLTASGLPIALGRMIALRVNRGQYKNAKQVFKAGLILCLVAGVLLSGLQFLLSGLFASQLIRLPLSRLAIQCLAPAILIVLLSSAFRGFFQGMGSMMPTCVSKLLSGIIQFAMCLVFGFMVLSYGKKVSVVLNETSYAFSFGASGVSIGILTGEIFSFAFLVLLYAAYNKSFKKQELRDTTKNTETVPEILSMLGTAVFPFMVNGFVFHCNVILNQIIYNHALGGLEQPVLAADFGIYYGKYCVLTGIPIAVLAVMTDNFSTIYGKLIARENYHHGRRLFTDSLKEVLLVSVISTVVLMVLAGPLIEILYKGDSVTAIKMLRIGSVSVIFYGLALLSGAALQARRKIWLSNISIIAGLVLQAIILKVLLETTKLGILSVVIANIVFPLLITAGNMLFLKKCEE